MLYYLGNTVTVGIKEYSHCLSTLGIHLIKYYFGTAVNVKLLWDYNEWNIELRLEYIKCNTSWGMHLRFVIHACIYNLSFMLVL